MQNVIEYTIVKGKLDVVIEKVNALIKDGWQPLGSCQDRSSENDYLGMQTMVKYQQID